MKKIPLSQGKFALVDANDFDVLNQYGWYLSHYGYAVRSEGNKKVLMHRQVLDVGADSDCDHINRNKLDNRKVNLRVVSRGQNLLNKSPSSRNKSGYKGVHLCNCTNKWRAVIQLNGKSSSLGRYPTPQEAALAYNRAAQQLFGEFAYLNTV